MKYTSLALASLTALSVNFGGASEAQAQGPSASVRIVDGKTGRTYNQTVQCNDYLRVKDPTTGDTVLYLTNKAAAQIDIGNDVRLQSIDVTQITDIPSIERLSPSFHKWAVDSVNAGHPECAVLAVVQSQLSNVIRDTLSDHFTKSHKIEPAAAAAIIDGARNDCALALGVK